MSSAGSELTAPVLLLAMPQVLDPFFHRSVVLLAHHEDGGSFGFIVNRPTGIRVSEILSGMEVSWRGRDEAVAYFGGPVQPQLGTVLWTPESVDGERALGETASWILPGIAITQHIGDLSELAERPPERFRLILGYAGWGAGQLLDEILRNDWLTAPVDNDLIFGPDPERIWSNALRSVGVDPAALPSFPSAGGGEETTN
jgi:putative transcriptional regulator